ncbi:MAG TPA: arginine--tRNA ligase [Terriglobales bacterium]|nr:arginine--tRNA ligase [Terriglobales bacterium]
MYRYLERRLVERLREFLRRTYDLESANIVVEQPPKIEFGEYALPIAFELARKLRKAPRKIAEEIVAGVGAISGFEKFEVAGGGYINVRVSRAELASALTADEEPAAEVPTGKVLVEHSSINPNKAAHIGHLRNAILGDTFVRLLRFAGREVDVQNYIDNTGVQVADVVVGFLHIEQKSRGQIEALAAAPRFDYVCWDLYARVSHWYEDDKANLQARAAMLRLIEEGNNETAAIANLISTAVLKRHLETMDRLDIEYDFLPRESEILHLHFWDAAFAKLKEAGVLTYESAGKNQGCWIMRRAGTAATPLTTGGTADPSTSPSASLGASAKQAGSGEKITEEKIAEEEQKVIVRSNGTVGYVGKDIAYHMWKFGLLGRDFGYRKFYRYPNAHDCWSSTTEGEKDHPHFGDVAEIYNVIDARQSEAQNTVIEALRGLGHGEAADRYTHFSYEMVALTPRCAAELGYQLSEEDKARPWIEVSGRKGFGVKADDLLDALITSAGKEVDARHPELSEAERASIATQVAIGALRYFMLKFTKPSVIAFDFKDALSFEGDTGPYAQYAVVRASNIFRKGGLDPESFCRDASPGNPSSINPGAARDEASLVSTEDFAQYLAGESGNDIWELWLAAAKTSYIVGQCIATTEPAYLAKHAFQLAQLFNTFYHRYPILSEADEGRRKFLLATVAVVRRELIRVLAAMGIGVPPVM